MWVKHKKIEAPKYLNEWMSELLEKVDKNDKTSSQICGFLHGLMQCPWENIKSVSLDWEKMECVYEEETIIKPRIKIEFK